jgi:hypothetical protein
VLLSLRYVLAVGILILAGTRKGSFLLGEDETVRVVAAIAGG